MGSRILVVDDEAEFLSEVKESLVAEGYDCLTGASGEEGLQLIRKYPDISVVVTDLQMPGRSGSAMISAAVNELPDPREMEFIVMTGHGDVREAIGALKLGVVDFLQKPVDLPQLTCAVRHADRLVLENRAQRFLGEGLKADVESKTLEIQSLFGSLQEAYSEALGCLAVAAEFKDPETGNHIQRIGAYSAALAQELGWGIERQEMIRLAAPLHDVGKIGIPESILLKPDKLTPEEKVIMEGHARIGHQILARSNRPVMVMAANIALGHHERWDGGGYPEGLRGDEIPIEARIAAVVDVYDALRSDRPYKFGFDQETTLTVMLEGDGRTDPDHFDPELLAILRAKSDLFAEIFEDMSDDG